eukprot:CAMPEP_0197842080 /NCGR_PEP_ID=MMETSP1437-20131217/46540_1 /TAXON_ID=49252 ORGANISM="Eucampia antarctica, Strain CCMP1452" /NCGR_SAMPLE_ID=MMETSP1437 /ASSEMBLY_ACC=CAM_ASM_001096 /LENGTH=62 /DNA_ID=CAMNT_0043451917 /DNA_START=1863 /DNA_END=2051 /DNA_ORIENTATION=+
MAIVFVANAGSFDSLGGTITTAVQTGDSLSHYSYGIIYEAGTSRDFAAKLNGPINKRSGSIR